MRFRVLAAVCLAAIGAVTLSCGKEGSQKEILVGEYGSLTGGIATFGISTRDGIPARVRRGQRRGRGSRARRSSCSSRTTSASPRKPATAVNKLINQDHVVAMLGEVASSRSLAAAPDLRRRSKVPMISPSSTNPR